MTDADDHLGLGARRERLHEIIFEADTRAGKMFDVALLVAIASSVLAVMLESVPSIAAGYGAPLRVVEWGFTVLFTLEYLLRLTCVRRPLRYASSFYGIVDLLAILPTYLSLAFAGTQSLLVIRVLRMLRVFRVFKMARYLGEANVLWQAVRSSGHKVAVFFGTVASLVVIIGAVMYLVEGPANGFTSIPESIYWAVVTITTVGYGDIAPVTPLGKFLATIVMVLGFSIIAVPTGIVSAELAHGRGVSGQACRACSREGHDRDAVHCKYCGAAL